MKIVWDIEKVLLSFMLVITLGMVGVIFWQKSVHAELVRRMPIAEQQLADVGKRYQQNHILTLELNNDSVAMGTRPIKYLSTQMTKSNIGKGSFKIGSSKSPTQKDGYEDEDMELKPAPGIKSFSREAIARFLLFVEANTNRMKITGLRLTMDQGRSVEDDYWQPIITVTDRRPTIVE
jgi:hypothetical protein